MKVTTTINSPVDRKRAAKAGRKAASLSRALACPPLNEALIWQPIARGWRQLYGSFYELGVSVEWHDFELERPFDWSRSFHPGSLELCLNLSGEGWVRCDGKTMDFGPSTGGFFLPGQGGLMAGRNSGQQHRFVSVE